MPLYEYRCQTCDDRFELRRPMAQADAPAPCPSGHPHATRLLAVFAATGRTTGSDSLPAGMPPGPCSDSCACYPE